MHPLSLIHREHLCWLVDTATDREIDTLPLVLRQQVYALKKRVHARERQHRRRTLVRCVLPPDGSDTPATREREA